MQSQGQSVAVQFSAVCYTNFGESVYITGNIEELGHWSPTQGVRLQTDSESYPLWSTKQSILLRQHSEIQFKICVVSPQGHVSRWEDLDGNRFMCLDKSCSVSMTEGEQHADYSFSSKELNQEQQSPDSHQELLPTIKEESDNSSENNPEGQKINRQMDVPVEVQIGQESELLIC